LKTSIEELVDPNVNVMRRLPKGNRNQVPMCLDINRIETIRKSVLCYADGSLIDKFLLWKKCINAMTKKQLELKKKFTIL